ncbi:MAG: UDP-N-acetylglucosamine--N-acetylmuramyl-(pentapeptide) pyrophosphoryl-undecaprenol N-acetylglucosamine transferase [Planctomycetaceae bacterium]
MDSAPLQVPGSPVVLFAGGGTGGHLTPALAVADRLRELAPHARLAFASSDRAIDRRLLPATDRYVLPLQPIASAAWHPLRFGRSCWGTWQAVRRVFAELNPSVVVGVGGLVSFPVLCTAWRRGIPTVLLEQNAIPGRANRVASRFATAVCVSCPSPPGQWPARLKVFETGNPVRAGIASLAPSRAPTQRPRPELPANTGQTAAGQTAAGQSDSSPGFLVNPSAAPRQTVLVLGGSQGARALNLAMIRLLAHADPIFRQFDWMHQTGPQLTDEVRQAYARAGLRAEVAAFFNPIDPHLRHAALAITRGGATTLAELACAGIPALIVPYPQATDNHQVANAQHYVANRGALLVPQEAEASHWEPRLEAHAVRLLTNTAERTQRAEAMRRLARPDADTAVCRVLLDLIHPSRIPQAG